MLLEEHVCYDQCVLLAKLLVFALLHLVLQSQICLLLQVSLDKPVAMLTKKKREKIQVTKRGNITTDLIK